MSFHARCPQWIASRSAHRTVWRQKCVRYYVANVVNDPEWFQLLRTELLSRNPIYQQEDIDIVHHTRLLTTLEGFVPRNFKKDALAHLLTHFNLQVPSAKLLPDGTDPLHSPGEPWVRRMWAGGTVVLNPDVRHEFNALSLERGVACLERIKDVRLQGEDDTAKIFMTIERRFASFNQLARLSGGLNVHSYILQQVRDGVEWGDALLKEERNLVFLKAKTGTELVAMQAGQTLAPKYLAPPKDPDFAHTLTPTRSFLFRYSALTFNAHLLHLDPIYTRNVEGHRNLLVHGPLTLTLMLQTLTEHLRLSSPSETVTSIQYRNLAPLYCDEEMRICVKKRKTRALGTETVWDIWIEGPTGGMAVKAVIRTHQRKSTLSTEPVAETVKNVVLPDARTVARQAQDKLSALGQRDSSPGQLFQLSREERRKLWREENRARGERALSYIYSAPSPLSVQLPQLASHIERPSASSSNNAEPKVQLLQENSSMILRERHQFSRRWRKQWVGRALPYLYLYDTSPLIVRNFAVASEAEQSTESPSSSAQGSANNLVAKSTLNPSDPILSVTQIQRRASEQAPRFCTIESTTPRVALGRMNKLTNFPYLDSTKMSSTAAGSLATWRQRQQRALAVKTVHQTKLKDTEYTKDAEAGLRIRVIETEGPKDVLSVTNFQKPVDAQKRPRQPKQEVKPSVIKKVEQNSVRRVGVGLGDVEKQGKQKLWRIRKAMKKAFLAADER